MQKLKDSPQSIENDSQLFSRLKDLGDHPFNIIGLADREKFHTGMIAFVINSLDADLQRDFLKALWPDCVEQIDAECVDPYHAEVETGSIDLIVKLANRPSLWAEVKLKTTLSQGQADKYQKRLGASTGALFSIFDEAEDTAGLSHTKFPRVITAFFDRDAAKDWVQAREHPTDDTKALVRLWLEYLETLSAVTLRFEEVGLGRVCSDVDHLNHLLSTIKLKGIFQHYRFAQFRRSLEDLPSEIVVHQFNSHGNSGLDLVCGKRGTFSAGLQWQAGAVKLAVVHARKNHEDSEAVLRDLYRFVGGAEKCDETLRVSSGKFRSMTIARWDIFEQIDLERTTAFATWALAAQRWASKNQITGQLDAEIEG